MTLAERRDSDESDTWSEFKENVSKTQTELSARKGKRKLPLLSGFRTLRRYEHSYHKVEDKCKIDAEFETTGNEFAPSRGEIEANRRKWDLERKLQDADRKINSEEASGLERKHNVRPVAPTTAEVKQIEGNGTWRDDCRTQCRVEYRWILSAAPIANVI
ncbi:hypothetical protein PInf_012877 [Phytophthora infestans]|nr:hypothetical protein PInf_012877 [Phytophthora infestans]